MGVETYHLGFVGSDEVHKADGQYNAEAEDSYEYPKVSCDFLFFQSNSLVFQLLIEQSTRLQFFIVLDTFDTR